MSCPGRGASRSDAPLSRDPERLASASRHAILSRATIERWLHEHALLRLHPCEQTKRHSLHRSDERPRSPNKRAQGQTHTWLHAAVWRDPPRLFRNLRFGPGSTGARTFAEAVAARMEAQID